MATYPAYILSLSSTVTQRRRRIEHSPKAHERKISNAAVRLHLVGT